MLGARARTLRCGRCATEWVLPGPELGNGPDDTPQPEPVAEQEVPKEAPAPLVAVVAATETFADAVPALAIPERERPFVRVEERPSAPARPARREGGSAAAWLGWVASLVVLGLLAWGGYAYRGTVMHAWPPSERLYALLGLMPAPRP
jgi:hypothetical protein